MEFVNNIRLTRTVPIILPLAFSLLFAACGGSSDDDDDETQGSADTTISISETLNLNSAAPVLLDAQNASFTNGEGIGKIIAANASSPQPGNGYTASTVDIVNTATNSVADTLDFASNSPSLASNATATQIAAFFEIQSDDADASASTVVRLTLSTEAIAFGDQFSLNGTTITGNTRSEVMATIDALPSIVASIDSNGVITVAASDGNDLRLNLDNAAAGQTIGIESLRIGDAVSVIDSITIGDGQPNTKATIGGVVEVTLNYPLQLANPGSGTIFGMTIPNTYMSQNTFDPTDPDTYNDAGSVMISDSLGNDHTLTQYFVKQDDLAGTNPNRWTMYVLIDGRNVGDDDTGGNPLPAAFDLAFDSNGQLDTTTTDSIEISHWVPLDGSGNPNNAATASITIDITGSTQFGGPFALTNVNIN